MKAERRDAVVLRVLGKTPLQLRREHRLRHLGPSVQLQRQRPRNRVALLHLAQQVFRIALVDGDSIGDIHHVRAGRDDAGVGGEVREEKEGEEEVREVVGRVDDLGFVFGCLLLVKQPSCAESLNETFEEQGSEASACQR